MSAAGDRPPDGSSGIKATALPRFIMAQNVQFWLSGTSSGFCPRSDQIGGYARASYAGGGGGASRVPRIAGDVTVGPAHANCVRVSYAPCAERRRFDLLRRG